jgi:hypothetical protein
MKFQILIPAFAGMTEGRAGMTEKGVGMTEGVVAIFLLLIFFTLILGCGGKGGVAPEGFSLSGITITPGQTSANIAWNANYPAKGVIYYGISDTALTNIAVDTSLFATSHNTTLSNLAKGTVYYFRISAWTEDAQQYETAIANFTTLPKTENEPIISGLTITDITATTATISWITDEYSDSRALYGLNIAFTDSVVDTVLCIEHTLELTGLTPETLYLLKVASVDSEDYRGESPDTNFTTLALTTIGVPDSTVSLGAIFNLPFTVSNALDLEGLQYYINYTSGILTALNVIEGPFSADNDREFFQFTMDTVAGLVSNSVTWQITYAGDVPIGTEADGDGIVSYIQFRADAIGTSPVSFIPDSTVFIDMYGDEFEGGVDSGIVTVE